MKNTNIHNNTPSTSSSSWAVLRKLLYIGLGLKRWLLVGGAGIALCAIGLAVVIKNILALTLPNILPWHLEGLVVGATGVGLIFLSIYGLYKSLGPLLLRYQNVNSLAQTIYTRRLRERGPKIVAIGGGTGLSKLLSGIKAYTDNITAIITVADDGGSSGRLRRELGLLPPGDFRNCLVALSEEEGLVADLFQYRFAQGDGLKGHSFGNLFIAAMTRMTGSFEKALYESSRVLSVHGLILPSTTNHLRLVAQLDNGSLVRGESNITSSSGTIEQIMIEPADCEAHPEAINAIDNAQLILIGPGSLYTSLVPNLLVNGIVNALQRSSAPKMYICNVATEKGETDGYTVFDHVNALQKQTFRGVVDYVIANNHRVSAHQGPESLPLIDNTDGTQNVELITGDIIDRQIPIHHDPVKLAGLIIEVYHGRGVIAYDEHETSIGKIK